MAVQVDPLVWEQAIARMLERGESADAAIAGFNVETGHDYTSDHCLTYWKSRNLEDFAVEAARPARPKVANVTREQAPADHDRLRLRRWKPMGGCPGSAPDAAWALVVWPTRPPRTSAPSPPHGRS
ncbi:hypothetical protein [Micromonospora sp. NPDC007230]|uniref:hypothetical protein n=1 Tax=Micromonospora sp. NPDC007230 TaxID=3364237 RepID=UPI0036A9A6FE